MAILNKFMDSVAGSGTKGRTGATTHEFLKGLPGGHCPGLLLLLHGRGQLSAFTQVANALTWNSYLKKQLVSVLVG